MTRNNAREMAVRLCYALSENPRPADDFLTEFFEDEHYAVMASEDELFAEKPRGKNLEYITRVVRGISEHSAELDGYIEKYSKGWKFERISRTAHAVIKVAMFEIMYMPDVPDGVAINEAVEISRKYDIEETVKFVNGLLGSFKKGEAF
ncbi:MAG: transcription antitermination factor NusB [Oscillospiraceae bacterium]|nr:transcription antitermination factor NusB [Oscillospiraceae bacterium]